MDDEAELARLITFLDQSGDRAGALAAYDDFARRLWAEYEAEPSPETQAVIREVRSRSMPAASVAAAPTAAAVAPPVPNVAPDSVAARDIEPRQRSRRALMSLAVGGVLALSGYLVAFANRRTPASYTAIPVQPADGLASDTAVTVEAAALAAGRRITPTRCISTSKRGTGGIDAAGRTS